MTDTTEDLPPTWNNFTTSSHLSAKTKERIAREVLVIRHHWPQDWQDQLRAGDINIQDQPSFHLAITLAQLSGFEPNIIRLLATLPDFRAFQEAQAPVSGKQVNPRTSTLFGTAKQRIEYTSYRFLEAWLDYLKPPVLPTSVETSRSKRAAARKATKRDAPSPPANTTRRRRTRTSVALVEVGRSGETNDTAAGRSSPGVSEAEDQSIFANSEIEEPGVQLTFDEELTITSALNTANTYTLQHPFNMSQATADMLEDPILRELARLLLEAKERDRALKQGRCDAARQKIESDPTIEKLDADRTAEEKLRAFLSAHQAEYRRLASASVLAAGNADALDPTDAEDIIAALTTKIEAYEAATQKLAEAEARLDAAEKACADSSSALDVFGKRLGVFRDTNHDWDNEFRFCTLGNELAKAKDA